MSKIYVSVKNIILFIVLSLPLLAFAQWTPFIRNYDKDLYGKGAQMWQISSYNRSWTFFANQNGLVQFDGTRWTLFMLHNQSYARSVKVSPTEGKVYVGGVNEYGWFSLSDAGEMSYTCLSDSVGEEERNIGNIWNVQESNAGIYYVGDNKIIRYFNDEFTMVDASMKIECSALLDDVLYVGTDRGIFMLAGKTLYPAKGNELLDGFRIRSIQPYKDGLLIASSQGEFFVFRKGQIELFDISVKNELGESDELFSIAVNDTYIAVGTVRQGIILINTETGGKTFFSENNGLQNNTVLSITFDAIGNLWAGLDSGTDYIYLTMPYTNLYTSRNSFGAGYAMAIEDDRMYIGTNRGLYVTSINANYKPDLNNIEMISGTGGQVWNLTHVGSDLFCFHDRGMMLVKGKTIEYIDGVNGAWGCQPVMDHDDMLYVGTYDGLYIFRRENGKWRMSNRINGVGGSFQIFEQESSNVVWLDNGWTVSCFIISHDFKNFIERTDYSEKHGLPLGRITTLSRIRGRIYFSTIEGIYKFNHHNELFEPASELNDILSGQKNYLSVLEVKAVKDSVKTSRLVAMSEDDISVADLAYSKNDPKAISYTAPIHQQLISVVPNFAKIIPIADSLYVIPTDKGFALFNEAVSSKLKSHYHSFHIRSMVSTTPSDSLLYQCNFINKRVEPVLTYEMNSIRFNYDVTMECSENVQYRYRLTGSQWSDLSVDGIKEYSNLREGKYTFEIEAVVADDVVEYDSISFIVLPPWYRSVWAYIGYFLFCLLILAIIYQLEQRRVLRKEEMIVHEKDQEMAAREREFEIQQQQHKSQEMANLMINLARKNEMLGEIKEQITHVLSSLKVGDIKGSSRDLVLLSSKIDSNIENDDLLKRVEEQFDLVHNNFMQRLSERHPDLSNNERMMCAYLKMNLSTKEIAPLLNISVRGVESMRYRLRKKLGLERDEGLISYLTEEYD